MYKIYITESKITVEFNSVTNIYIILNILYFYRNNKSTIIKKMILTSNKMGIKWYNDITSFIKKPLIFLLLKMRGEHIDNTINESHIDFSETNLTYFLEIHTINIVNPQPIIMDKESFKRIITKEILDDL